MFQSIQKLNNRKTYYFILILYGEKIKYSVI